MFSEFRAKITIICAFMENINLYGVLKRTIIWVKWKLIVKSRIVIQFHHAVIYLDIDIFLDLSDDPWYFVLLIFKPLAIYTYIDSIENIYLILFGTRGIRNYYLSSRYVLKINIYFLRLLIKLRSRLYPWLKYDGFVIRPINHFIMQTTINLLVTYGRVYHQSIHFEITLYLFSN